MTARPTEPLTGGEFAQMLACLDRRRRDDVRVGALLIALRVGLRRGEVIGLRLRDVLAVDGRVALSVRTLKQRSRRPRERVIPISNEDAAALVLKYVAQVHRASHPDAPLFSTMGKHGPWMKTAITPKAIDYWVKRMAVRAGIRKRITAHSFRHGCATDMLRGGSDLRTVQQVLGHASIASTSAYLHTSYERCADAVARLTFA